MSQEENEWDDPTGRDNELSDYQKGYLKGMVMMVIIELALFGLWNVLPL